MTTFQRIPIICAMCGERVEVTQLTSCSSWGSTMDGHRFFLGIDPLPYAIQRCPACGYSSPCLSSIEGVDTSVVTREWLSDIPLVTDRAIGYQTHAAICMASGMPDAAGISYLRAAWLCDDPDGEMTLRRKAAEALEYSDDPELLLICADVYRILGEFDRAREQLDVLASDPTGYNLAGLAAYERRLIDSRTTDRNVRAMADEVEIRPMHHLKAMPGVFSKIKSGTKIYEARLRDGKGRKMRVGDRIEFTDKHTSEKLYVEITDMRTYSSFGELYADIDPSDLGYLPGETADPKDMNRVYSRKDREEMGVMAIGFRVLPPRKRRSD